MRWLRPRQVVLALLAAASSAGAAQAQPAAISREALAGAWTPQGTRCADAQFVTVYLRDGRTYSSMTSKGPRTGGVFIVAGNVLEERVKTMPAFRTNSPALARYEDQYLIERRTVLKVTADRLDLGFPGNRNPNVTTPPLGKCPEGAGVEPWFPREPYGGFAPMRKLFPPAN